MAERNLHNNLDTSNVTEDRIQSLVRGILGEFLSSSGRNNEAQFSAVGDEINDFTYRKQAQLLND